MYTKLEAGASDEALREYARDRFIVGGPEECIEELRRYREALGTDTVLFRLQLPKLPDDKVRKAVRLLGERVLPRV